MLTFFEKITIGTIIGFVLFTLMAYGLLIINASFLLIPIFGLMSLFCTKNIFRSKMNYSAADCGVSLRASSSLKHSPPQQVFDPEISDQTAARYSGFRINLDLLPKKQLIFLFFVFILGITGQMAVIAPSGTYFNKDLVFWSSNGHDGAWHIALMEEIKKGYPLQNPAFAGEKLVNYHFFSDIAPAQFSKFFQFSNLDLYFRFFPFIFSVLLGSIAYLLGKKLGGSYSSGVWSVFFVYFAGSFGYIATWIKNQSIGGESIFWATQIQSSIGNPPQIISNILVMLFLYLFYIYLSKKDVVIFLLCFIVAGTLAVFKVYAALVILIGLGIVGLIQIIREKKFNVFSLFALSSLLSAILYIPNTQNSASFLIWEPWWFIRTMIVAPSRLNWLDLELKRQTYIAEGNWKRVLQIETTGFLIFFLGNLGTKFLGLIHLVKLLKKSSNNYLFQLIIFIIIISLILPLLFLQKGVAGNTSQFLQYFLLLFGILAALTVSLIQNKIKLKILKILFIVIIVALSVPTQIGLLYDFYHKPPLAKITSDEIEALNFLKLKTDNNTVILTPPHDKYLNLNIATPPIWAWFDTAYVSAFSARRTYIADTEQVDIMGYDLNKRLEMERKIFIDIENPHNLDKTLKEIGINYIYFPKILRPKLDLNKTDFLKLFDNNSIEIWKVN